MKNVLRCVAFTVITAIIISYVLNVLSLKDTSGGETEYYSAYRQLYNTDKNMVDVVFLGTSHCYNAIYPAVLWNEYGIAAFDMSVSAQSKRSTYHSLKEVLKTQSPKVVFVEMYGLMNDEYHGEGNIYRNYVTMRSSKNLYDLLKEENEENKVAALTKWPIVHTRYRELSKYDFEKKPFDEFGRGAEMRMGDIGGFVNHDYATNKAVEEVSVTNKKWIDDLYALSKEKGFELVLFMAPYSVFEREKAISNGAYEYATSLGIRYIDMNCDEIFDEMGYDPATDMMNDFHHNDMYGAVKISNYFGRLIKSDYNVADNRGNSDYRQWDLDYEQFLHLFNEYEMTQELSDTEYLEYISNLDDFSIVLSLDGDFDNAAGYMEYFGISEDDYAEGGKWIYKDGKAQKIMSNTLGESHIVSLGKFDGVKLQCMEDASMNIFYDLYPYVMTEDGLNVLVYDNFREKLISARAFW
jgi:hypothetical protein